MQINKFLSMMLVVAMVVSCMVITVSADSGINVTIDGEAKIFDVMPVIDDSRTLVPMRGIFEALGAEITWDDSSKTVTGTKDDTTVVLQIGNTVAKVNGNDVTLDVPAKIISSRTMVPVRFVSESLGCKVDWDDSTKTVIISSPAEDKVDLNGKKILFAGSSFIYYGKTVLEKGSDVLEQIYRNNDEGYFYQLCKANGAKVRVTNWTWGGHNLMDIFGESCGAERGCDGVNHLSYLTNLDYDYVVFTEGTQDGKNAGYDIVSNIKKMMGIFKEENPDVKFVLLIHRNMYTSKSADTYNPLFEGIPELKELGVTVADWGKLVCDIIDGRVQVPGSEKDYNRNSFIIRKSESDGYHPNMLTGYITSLMTYCAITGESAVGQDYSFCNDTSANEDFSFDGFIGKYYTYDNATTNFPEIFESEEDMKGIQQLIDEYLK